MVEEEPECIVLKGEEAMALWRSGRDAWNAWVEGNPKADIDFSGTIFKGARERLIDFQGFRFPDGDTSFSGCQFMNGSASFLRAKFGKGNFYFIGVTLDNCPLTFAGSRWSAGEKYFFGSKFNNAVVFDNCEFGAGGIHFNRCHFCGESRFANLQNLEDCELFSFEGSIFQNTLEISTYGRCGSPIDLRRTAIERSPVLNEVSCKFRADATSIFDWPPIANDPQDSQRFRRMKEIASSNRNHAKAIEFHVEEIRSKRGWETNSLQDAMQFFFWLLSDYGRSILRPFSWLILMWCYGGYLFWSVRIPSSEQNILTALTYSASNMLSFVPTGRTAKTQGEDILFGAIVPDSILMLSGVQSIISVVLLFLLGLGLRNLFRV